MVQSALDLKVWKEIAISKQLLIKTATDALGIDAECSEEELKVALEQGINKISDADARVVRIQADSDAALAEVQAKLKASEKASLDLIEANKEVSQQKLALEKLLEVERKTQAKEMLKVTTDLDKKVKQLKTINVTLADSPENVVKKMKALNKKKFDESNARKRAEEDARSLKKEKQDLQKTVKGNEENLAQAEKLVDAYRELRTFTEEQFTQLKGLVENEEELKAVPEQDKLLLEALEAKKEDDAEEK